MRRVCAATSPTTNLTTRTKNILLCGTSGARREGIGLGLTNVRTHVATITQHLKHKHHLATYALARPMSAFPVCPLLLHTTTRTTPNNTQRQQRRGYPTFGKSLRPKRVKKVRVEKPTVCSFPFLSLSFPP